MLKKLVLTLILVFSVTIVAGCQSKETNEEKNLFFYQQTYQDIASWGSMVTPGGGEGSVTQGDNVAIIKAASDGWGGVQSQPITLDLSKDPMLLIQVKESQDGFKWGVKFVPTNPQVEGHEWGVYLIEDNNFKWNNYAGCDIKAKLGQDFIDVYGEKVEGVLWIYASGSPEATVEITQVAMLNQK